MKVGILTFHSQLNYGGVLQCWALQTALEKMGHEVVVIDRWILKDASCRRFRERGGWLLRLFKVVVKTLLCAGESLRIRRTESFIDRCLKCTPYHFVKWAEAPKDLGVDLIVVGSDQVWHCGSWCDPLPYLLEGAPRIPAIAYAASFGMSEIPELIDVCGTNEAALPHYKSGLGRFSAISCREAEGVGICKTLGFEAVHVVDPTLLVAPHEWHVMCNRRNSSDSGKCRKLFCYFLEEEFIAVRPFLTAFARNNGCRVEVFVDGRFPIPLPRNAGLVKKLFNDLRCGMSRRVRLRKGGGPVEFVSSLADADWVLSDSFHALMLSVVFRRNIRMLRPKSGLRMKMFARIEEFAQHMEGGLLADSVSDALASFERGERVRVDEDWLARRISDSRSYLETAISQVGGEV